MFRKEADFEAFERVMVESHQRQPLRILSYCVLSNHWHFVVWPEEDGQLTGFFRKRAHTHAMRWRVSHRTVRYGHLYQGWFKSFPVQRDDHLLSLLRYVERNPVSAGLVERAQLWRWGSLWSRVHGDEAIQVLRLRGVKLCFWFPIHSMPLAGECTRCHCESIRTLLCLTKSEATPP